MSNAFNIAREQRQRMDPNALAAQSSYQPLPPAVRASNGELVWNRPGVYVGPQSVGDAIEESLKYRNALQDQVLNAPIPRAKPKVGPSPEDIFNAAGKVYDRENAFAEPVFRTSWMTANNRYARGADRELQLQRLIFPIARDQMDSNQPMLLLNENSLQDIVAMRFDEAIVPSSMFTTAELYLGRAMLRFPAFSGPALGSYEYYGSTTNASALQYHFECNIEALDTNRRRIVPVEKYHIFPSPARINDSEWSIIMMSPYRQIVPFPSPFLQGTITPTSPMTITIIAHGLVAPDFVTVETVGLNAQYTPFSEAYPITVINPNTIEIPIDATAIALGTPIMISSGTRLIRFHVRLLSLDKKSDVTAGTRIVAALSQ